MTKSQDSTVFDVRYADGSRIPQAAGSAVIVVILNTSTVPAAWSGTLLLLADYVLNVDINGCGRRACAVASGRYTKSGTRLRIQHGGESANVTIATVITYLTDPALLRRSKMIIDHAFLTILRSVRSDTHMALLPERKATSTERPINILLLRSKAGQSSM